jgi:EmrB/QacA subfamily drug resistance transporter
MSATSAIKADRIEGKEGSRLKVALLVIATAQLMLVLDDAIANIALPSIQRDLGVSVFTLPWIVNAYILAFGGLLLFGGRVGDLYGRKKVFKIGLIVFTLASLLGGFAPNGELLIASRGLQGLGAALTAPNALALIATNFPVGKSRNKAMAVYAAMSAVGMVVGVMLGGILTDLLSWRWVFFINVPIALAVLAGTDSLMEGQRNEGKLDISVAISGVLAMVALVFGITHSAEVGWSNSLTIGSLLVSLLMFAIFFIAQSRSKHPMLPLGLLSNRNRSGSYLAVVFIGAGLMGTFYLLALYLQQVLQFSPMQTGLASLPISVGIMLSAGISSKLVERFPPRAVAVPGLILGAVGLYWLSSLTASSSYATHVLPALLLSYFGLGMGFMPTSLTAVYQVPEGQTGVASALLNTSQQLGAALGLAVLTTVYTSFANRILPDASNAFQSGVAGQDSDVIAKANAALSEGYTTAFFAAAIMLLIAAVVVAIMVNTKHTQSATKTYKEKLN